MIKPTHKLSKTEMDAFAGKTGMLLTEGLMFPVVIRQARNDCGRIRFHITPVGGEKSKWVDSIRVILRRVKKIDAPPVAP